MTADRRYIRRAYIFLKKGPGSALTRVEAVLTVTVVLEFISAAGFFDEA